MRNPLRYLIVICALALMGHAVAERKTSGQFEFSTRAIRDHIEYLASQELEGRGTGSPGCEKAAAYIADQFRKCGLHPLGDKKSFFQVFEVTTGAHIGTHNKLLIATDNTPSRSYRVSEDFMPVPMSKTANATGDVAFVGYGITSPDPFYNDYEGIDVKDKIVLILRHTPDGNNPHGKFEKYGPLLSKLMQARENGAKAVLFCTGPHSPKEIQELGPWYVNQGFADVGIPAAYITREVAEKLLRAAGKKLGDVQREINNGQKPQSFEIPDTKISLETEVVKEKKKTANVIGYLPGHDSQAIVIGAHYDHLGRGEQPGSRAPSAKGEIHYGADDNASGTAGVIELARYFASRRKDLKHGMLFICFSGEEMGLLGSKHFVDNPTLPLTRTIAMLNLDMVGRLKNNQLYILGEGTSPFWKEALASANRDDSNQTLKFHVSAGGSGFGGSDHQSFYVKGIPVLHFFTGIHEEYHKPSDTADRINAEGELEILKLITQVTQKLDQTDGPLTFVKLDEMRPTGSGGGGGFRVYLGTVPDYAAEVEGVRLDGVRDGSPAAKSGVKAGDIIISFAGKSIRSVEEYSQALREAVAGKPTEIVVMRDGMKITLTIVPEAR